MKKIIVATDFSATAANAAKYAAQMALAVDAELHLLHIYELPVVYMELPISMTDAELTANARKAMNELKNSLFALTNNKVHIKSEIVMGTFFTELNTICNKIHPFAVIMGSQGKTAAERLFFGTHAVYAMKHLPWSLIAVPPEAKFSAIKTIGLACDFENVSETIPVDEIRSMVTDFDATLHILNIGKQDGFDSAIVRQSRILREKLSSSKPVYHFLADKNIDEGILNFAEKNKIDLLVIIPKSHSLIDKLMHKSHTRQMVLHSSYVPVMALHPEYHA
ncbi:universal stress protein [Panacibacter ginsenosidivorans]|uniref:Universal stress protein n=1 Tax=Panacibacter ginsenosidivorans TaxID=1813871 RepID=A0A5B8V511_9BACT|nr:universal stress protein [Panacibacter ginsenosidivorans]QEC66248.1 universal stress protein [Panacibacter ginsenosidivorans]